MFYQLIVLIVITPFVFGPLARFGLHHAIPDLYLIITWLFAWLTDRNTALRWAIMAGLTVDLLNFHLFGLYIITYIGIVLAIDYLKNRFFDVLSFTEALICLLGANIVILAVGYLAGANFNWQNWLFSILSDVAIGTIMYYLLATRFKIFAHWRGSNV
jgi:rod shape-determining protein MreD